MPMLSEKQTKQKSVPCFLEIYNFSSPFKGQIFKEKHKMSV